MDLVADEDGVRHHVESSPLSIDIDLPRPPLVVEADPEIERLLEEEATLDAALDAPIEVRFIYDYIRERLGHLRRARNNLPHDADVKFPVAYETWRSAYAEVLWLQDWFVRSHGKDPRDG